MSSFDPQRLREDASGPSHDLLEAWSTMRAPEGARLRAMALLTGAGPETGPGAGPGSSGLSSALVVKVGVVAALAVATAVYAGLPSDRNRVSTPTKMHAPVTAAAAAASSESAAAVVTGPAVTAVATPELVAIPVGALPSAPMTKATPTPASSALSAQLVELDAIRGSLTAGEHDLALAALHRFEARHPNSKLAEEAAALRFDVQSARGARAAAFDAARAFLAKYPQSPYAARIRRASTELP